MGVPAQFLSSFSCDRARALNRTEGSSSSEGGAVGFLSTVGNEVGAEHKFWPLMSLISSGLLCSPACPTLPMSGAQDRTGTQSPNTKEALREFLLRGERSGICFGKLWLHGNRTGAFPAASASTAPFAAESFNICLLSLEFFFSSVTLIA